MYRITNEMAQELVEFVSAETGFGMIVCDTHGVIIGDSLRERLGIHHAGAARVMRGDADSLAITKEDEIASERKMREGYNCVIKIEGERIGTFGITGPVEIVKPVAKIASTVIAYRIKEAQNRDLLREMVTQVSVNVQQASAAIEKIAAGANDLMVTGKSVAQAVEETEKKVKATNVVLNLILEVADQSKLLGLNAAILAAQAGIHGKGFTVVADEIRKLAATSGSSAEKIPVILAEIRSALAGVNSSSQQTSAISGEQSRALLDITRVMEEIQKSVNILADSVR